MRPIFLCVVFSAAFSVGCTSAHTRYVPQVVARGELTLRYDDRFELWAAGRPVAYGTSYDNLPEFVACVPDAKRHADAARSSGSDATIYSGLGVGFGTLTFGGLAGLAFQDKPAVMGAFFAGGAASAALGLTFGALSRSARNDANGHAVDAMNYYNDAVGSVGGSCFDRGPALNPALPSGSIEQPPANPQPTAPPQP